MFNIQRIVSKCIQQQQALLTKKIMRGYQCNLGVKE